MLRYRLSQRLTPAQLESLWPAMGPAGSAEARPTETRDEGRRTEVTGADELSPWSTLLYERGASNNWVVAGARTKSGKPLLANDPHLPLMAPIQWYLARIEAPGLTLAGATAPGVPIMVIGHNGHV